MYSYLKYFSKQVFTAVTILSLLGAPVMADEGEGAPPSTLRNVNYRDMFDQQEISLQFQTFLRSLGVPDENLESVPVSVCSSLFCRRPAPIEGFRGILSEFEETEAWKLYVKAVLSKRARVRMLALTSRARAAAAEGTLLAVGTAGTVAAIGEGSHGGSFAIFQAFFSSVTLMRNIIYGVFDAFNPTTSPLDSLEEQFAIYKCFIPNELWTYGTNLFMLGRQNLSTQREMLERIRFVLGLTVYRPSKTELSTIESSRKSIKKNLLSSIDAFFNDYQVGEKELQELSSIKLKILTFINSLLGAREDISCAPQCIYLNGDGGIGKTHFVNQLKDWIETAMNVRGLLHMESAKVETSSDLEGDERKPGLFLSAARNQYAKGAIGSIVFGDEIKFDNAGIVSCAKRVINGEFSTIPTTYFGSEVRSDALHMPPTLVVFSANVELGDDALKSRFAVMKFPHPKVETLVRHGEQFYASKINLPALVESDPSVAKIKKSIEERFAERSGKMGFREIEGLLSGLLVADPRYFGDESVESAGTGIRRRGLGGIRGESGDGAKTGAGV